MTKFFFIILLFFFHEKSLHGDTVIFIEEGQALSCFPEPVAKFAKQLVFIYDIRYPPTRQNEISFPYIVILVIKKVVSMTTNSKLNIYFKFEKGCVF